MAGGAVIQDARLGDRGGWSPVLTDLYRSRYTGFVRLAFLLTGSNSIAEEVVQDAFVRVRHAVDRVEYPAAYLRAAVVNGCRNHARRLEVERRHQRTELRRVATDDPDYLADALARLPERQRAVLVLRYYEGLTETEIADVLGCRNGTVKSATSRALASLRAAIEQ